MEFRILGPLEVWDDGGEVSLGGPKPRALLAVLLLHPNEVVSADRLIDELWGEDSPERAADALRVNVSRLRKALPQDVLTTRSPGYVIRVEPDELDLHRFERLVDEGRSLLARGLAADASERLRDALALWRGPPLADFAYESFAQAAIARLEEIRLAAVELRIDADLVLGRHHELVAELEALVAEHPLRERLRRQSDDGAVPDGSAGRGPGCLPGRASGPRRRAGDRSEPGAPGAGAGDPSPGPVAGCRGDRACRCAGCSRAVDSRRSHARDAHRCAARGRRAARATPASRPDSGQARGGPSRPSVRVSLARGAPALRSKHVVSRPARPRSQSTAPGEELARLATELDVDLLLADAPDELLSEGVPDEQLTALLEEAPCDVALLAPRAPTPEGPVLVPFGGAEHDWAAVELGAWFARAADAPLRLAGAAAVPEQGRRDASRLLSHGALAVQRVLGISAEPLLTPPGEEGMLEASRDAGLLVVGLSTRWHREGLGQARLRLAREAAPPTLLVRRGLRPGGLAPPADADAFHLVDSP